MEELAIQNTIDEMIDILKAFKAGNGVERRLIDNNTDNMSWEDITLPNFNFERYQYRVSSIQEDDLYIIGFIDKAPSYDQSYLENIGFNDDIIIETLKYCSVKERASKFTHKDAEFIVEKLKEKIGKDYLCIYTRPFIPTAMSDQLLDKAYSSVKEAYDVIMTTKSKHSTEKRSC